MIDRAELLHAHGFAVLLFDFQAHGESSGRRITFGHLEAMDAAAVLDFLRHPVEQITHLTERGSVVGGSGRDEDGRRHVAYDVDRTQVVHAKAQERRQQGLEHRREHRYECRAQDRPERCAQPICKSRIDVRVDAFEHQRIKPQRRRCEHGRSAPKRSADCPDPFPRETLPEPKLFWAVQGAGHVDLEAYAPADYRRIVLPFLVEHLQVK
jgi:hypothetical protein